MASKSSTSTMDTTTDPRIAAKEIIITRHKSAQLKRQLRSGDRSMRRITKLLKSPERQPTFTKSNAHSPKTYKNTTVKQKSSPKSLTPLAARRKALLKSPRKRKVTEKCNNAEYYPDKGKRTVVPKRVTLQSKNKLTTVHSLNKRKRTTPRKGTTTPLPVQNPPTPPTLEQTPSPQAAPLDEQDLTVVDLVNAFDEDSLTNEDFMEILTCPSPVWWEDPPDECFTDEPLPSTILGMNSQRGRQKRTTKSAYSTDSTALDEEKGASTVESETIDKKHEEVEGKPAAVDLQVELTKKDDKFIKKRSVLENVLSGIKTKTISRKSDSKKANSDTLTNAEFDEVLRENSEALQRSLLRHKPAILKSETRFKEDVADASSDTNIQGSSEDIFSDTRQEEILNDLENINIPMESSKGVEEKSTLSKDVECIVLEEDENQGLVQISPVEKSMEATLVEGTNDVSSLGSKGFQRPESLLKIAVWSRKREKNKTKVKSCGETARPEVPADMPPLKKYSKSTENKMASPGSSKFESSESDFDNSSVLSSQDGDTISDTNVRYLNDDQISDYDSDRRSKKDFDSGIPLLDSDRSKTEDVKENPNKSEEGEQFFLKEEKSDVGNEIANECTANDTEIDGKKDCIVVYKIIETVSSCDANHTVNDNVQKKIFAKRRQTAKRCANKNAPKNSESTQKNVNKQLKPTFTNLEELFRNYKKCTKRKSKYKIDKSLVFDRIICNLNGEKSSYSKKTESDVKKPIAVTDRKTVNYCLKCLAIFDTKTCIYCVKINRDDDSH